MSDETVMEGGGEDPTVDAAAAKLKARREARRAEQPAPGATPDKPSAKPAAKAPIRAPAKADTPEDESVEKKQKPKLEKPSPVKAGAQPGEQPNKDSSASPSDDTPEAESPESEHDETETPAEEETPEPKFKVLTAEGKEDELPISEITRGYMRQADYTRKTTDLKVRTDRFLREQSQYTQIRDNTLGELETLSQLLVAELTDQSKSGEIEALRNTDPAEYAARMADIERKRNLLRNVLGTSNATRTAEARRQQRAFTERMSEEVKENDRQLVMAVPELADKGKRTAFKSEVRDFLTRQGYSAEELSQLTDFRSLLIARKAIAYDKAQAALKKARGEKHEPERVPAAPQRSATPERKDSVSAKIDGGAAKLRKTGDIHDAAALLKLKREARLNKIQRR